MYLLIAVSFLTHKNYINNYIFKQFNNSLFVKAILLTFHCIYFPINNNVIQTGGLEFRSNDKLPNNSRENS